MQVVEASFLSANQIVLTFEAGSVVHGRLVPYVAGPDDRVEMADDLARHRIVYRDDQPYGMLAGDGDQIQRFDTFETTSYSDFFDADNNGLAAGDLNDSYLLSGDSAVDVVDVFRKSKILETAVVGYRDYEARVQHQVVLELDRPLSNGEQVSISFNSGPNESVDVGYQPENIRSVAVHASHIGFETDDPAKAAFVSYWMGRNNEDSQPGNEIFGSFNLDPTTSFSVVDVATGNVVHSGQLEPSGTNFLGEKLTRADVLKADFSSLDDPGTYQVYVDGVGTSYTFEIAEDVWTDAFAHAARGFYHQRSGIPLEQPHTDWTRPRDLHPDDGFTVHWSTATLMDTSMGLNLLGQSSFEALVAGATSIEVADAWGGWHDAGDWDRRIQHLETVRKLIHFSDIASDFVESVDLNIPESDNTIPDLLDEALWGLDVFSRLQQADGGVSGGIEAEQHPNGGESSWTMSQDLFAFTPGRVVIL